MSEPRHTHSPDVFPVAGCPRCMGMSMDDHWAEQRVRKEQNMRENAGLLFGPDCTP